MAATVLEQRATLSQLPAEFSLSFLKNVKVALRSKKKGFQFFSEGYFHDVSLFTGNGKTIFVTAKAYRSQRKRADPHSIHIDIAPEDKKIVYAHCSCQAGVIGSCSHVIGLVIALEQWQLMGFTEPPKHLPSTSLPRQWGVPRGPRIEPVDVPHLIFVNPKPDRKKRPVQNILTECRKIKVQRKDLDHLKTLTTCPISYLVCSPEMTIDTHVGQVPVGSGLSTHAKFFEPEETKPVGTNCGNLSFPQLASVTVKEEYHVDEITKEECEQIEEKTRDQINSTLWVEERKGRITASKFGMISKRKHVTENFLRSLTNPTSFTSAQTSYGVNNEKTAIQKYIKESGNHVHDCGLVVNPKFPFLGATPDGKVCEDGVTGLIEVKCPYSARDLTVQEASRTKSFYLENNNGTITLKKKT